MKVSLKTRNGKWYVNDGYLTIPFENALHALYFICVGKVGA